MKIDLPVYVILPSGKKFYLNLNTYRNAHYHTLNTAKKLFQDALKPVLEPLGSMPRISLEYTWYPGTKRRTDIANVLSIVDKFFCDSLVQYGVIQDDSYEDIPVIQYKVGEFRKGSTSVEVKISPI